MSNKPEIKHIPFDMKLYRSGAKAICKHSDAFFQSGAQVIQIVDSRDCIPRVDGTPKVELHEPFFLLITSDGNKALRSTHWLEENLAHAVELKKVSIWVAIDADASIRDTYKTEAFARSLCPPNCRIVELSSDVMVGQSE